MHSVAIADFFIVLLFHSGYWIRSLQCLLVKNSGKLDIALSMKVLLVEDNPLDVKILELFLEHYPAPIELKVITDGQEALTFLKKTSPYESAPNPDLVLLDLHLPKKDGLEILSEIRADNSFCALPVYMMSSSSEKSDIDRANRLGVTRYFVKTGDVKETYSNFEYIFKSCF